MAKRVTHRSWHSQMDQATSTEREWALESEHQPRIFTYFGWSRINFHSWWLNLSRVLNDQRDGTALINLSQEVVISLDLKTLTLAHWKRVIELSDFNVYLRSLSDVSRACQRSLDCQYLSEWEPIQDRILELRWVLMVDTIYRESLNWEVAWVQEILVFARSCSSLREHQLNLALSRNGVDISEAYFNGLAPNSKCVAAIRHCALADILWLEWNQVDVLLLIFNFLTTWIKSFDLVALLQKPKGWRIFCT